MQRKYLNLFSIAGLVLCLDQITKSIVELRLEDGVRYEIIPSLLSVYRSHNSGFAFGMWKSAPQAFQDVFFIGIPVFALVLIVLIFIKLQDNQYLTSIALTTILAGAVGNLVDRIRYGFVIDFLDIHLGGLFHFPPFNIADGSIILGVSIMFLHTLMSGRQTTRESY